MKLVRPRNYITILILVSIALFFSHLEVLFANIMEARNFITAKEMVTYDNWLLTTMNLEPRYEKPPLPTWLSALTGMLFGFKNMLAMRAPAALSGVFLVLMLYYLSVSLLKDKKQAFINALIVATSFYIIFIARDGSWDVFTHAFMLGAIWFLFQFFESDEHRWKNSLMAAVLIGLSFLSKGPIGMFSLLTPFLVAYAIIFKFINFKQKWWPITIGVLVVILISSWWPLYIYFSDTNTVELIADKEMAARSNRHVRPWYHYWSFPVQTGIWAIPAIISLMYPYLKSRVENLKGYQFTLIWTLVGVVLLSIVPEKKERYLVPVLIPMAINIGFYVRYLIQKGADLKTKKELFPAYFGFGIIGVIGIAFPFVGYIFLKDNLMSYWSWFLLTSIVVFLSGIFILIQLKKKNFGKVFTAIIVFQLSILVFGFPLAKSFYNNDAFKNINELHIIEQEQQIKSYSFGVLSPELIWKYDGVIKNIYQDKKLQLPADISFGLLVAENQKEEFLKLFENGFEINYITRFDVNYIVNKKKKHRNTRLTSDFYILKKNNFN
ncbi:MAG: glycosyltransferase family 39 protein [Flavobacteriaceae bacterium]|nr:glycosyltransferase family 39 protein [Flavobacteriaceae bacterium]